ncbi:MAG: GIY-YIG nuclease family protein [Candidatus Marinimicrobia bacterium]|nr:GIY-YIG nuclease family protein [Candidatus Neomarinimicrobiota bacterium]
MENQPTFIVYILQNPNSIFYIGQTKDLDKRIIKHNSNLCKYTRNKGPWIVVHEEVYSTRSDAMKRERQLKKWRRELLINMINSESTKE